MQAGPPDDGAGQFDRLEIGHRRDRARFANLHANVQQSGGGFVFLEFVGDHPARAFAGAAEPLALGEIIDLQHQPVDFEIELVQAFDQFLAVVDGGLEVVEAFDVRRGGQAIAAELGQELHVGGGFQPLAIADAVAKQPQPPAGRLARIEQPNAAGGAVARVGVCRLAAVLLLLVEADQIGVGHVDFAAHFQHARRFVVEPQRNATHGAHVVRDVVADATVAAGGRLRQRPFS